MSLPLNHQAVTPQANYFVISGCSGSGKSTLLKALRQRGKMGVPEPGRRVVKEQLAAGLDGLPWKNTQRFVEECTKKAAKDFKGHLDLRGSVFFDRSLIDIVSAVEASDLTMPANLSEAVGSMRYASTVFMSKPWEALFQTDEERRHGFEEATDEYKRLVLTYQKYGYELIFLPRASVKERVAFISSRLA